MIWAGDFNRHHPLWDNNNNIHLFTQQANNQAEKLIELIATYNLNMALLKGTPTLQHMVTKKYSRPDNVFVTGGLTELITICKVDPILQPPYTDHFPIITNLQIPQQRAITPPNYNFKEVNWKLFRSNLSNKLITSPIPAQLQNKEQIKTAINSLTNSIQETIKELVMQTKPRPNTKRWWNANLNNMKKKLNRIKSLSFKFHAIANHPSHHTFRTDTKTYGKAIVQAKRSHWENYLEEMTADEIWVTNKYLKNPSGDGGLTRIPTLKSTSITGITSIIDNNESKASLLAKTLFPQPPPNPQQADNQLQEAYPEPYPNPPPIMSNQVTIMSNQVNYVQPGNSSLEKLSLYKAHRPDNIPNIVLKECADLINMPLTNIFKAIIDLDMYHNPWKEFTTIILRKLSKPNYKIPKAYRPIALISMMAKLLMAIIAEHLSNIVEHHQILPKNHFGSQPGRSTVDVIHCLISKIHKAWNQNKVVSILFLNVEGTFPNAVTACLMHNMKQQRIPTSMINFVQNLLTKRSTCIKFDNYVSELFALENGIGQGDPLSMILYILYNADLLDLPVNNEEEDALSYVDDIALVTTGDDLYQTTQRLENIMTKKWWRIRMEQNSQL